MPKINTEYDIGKAFEAIENELIASMIRNMKSHKLEEIDEDKQWTMWQAEQLKALEKYKKENLEKYKDVFKDINSQIKALISIAKSEGEMSQEIAILNAIKNGFKAERIDRGTYGEFFKLNERKLEALIKATTDDMEKAETAVLRMANDQYRKVIYNAQVYANTGAGTYEKAVDMATKDMLSAGLNCIVYANGARHTLSDYADMAIRTASKRAYLQGEGLKRQEWKISTVIVNKRGNPCPKCLPFCGKVLIDDVWSGGKASDGPYPLMSKAIEYGLYHPRCKDSHTTYFPGISSADDTWTEKELEAVGLKAKQEAKQQYAKRQEDKFKRLAKYSLDPENRKEYAKKAREWNIAAAKRFDNYDELEKYIKQIYNGTVDEDVRNLDIRQVNISFAEFEKVISDFPEIEKYFSGLNTTPLGKAAFVPNGELAFNPAHYDKISSKLFGTGFHEAGHLIELSLIKKYNPNLDDETVYQLYAEGIFAKNLVNAAYSRIGSSRTLTELRREISNYALKDESETLAEAVKDYYCNGYSSSILSRQIIKIIAEELK